MNNHKISSPKFDVDYIKKIKHKTPYFLFDKKIIKDNLKKFKKAFPKSTIYYAMKANSEPHVLKTVNDAGFGFEVASKYELTMLKKIKVDPSKIIYGTSVKPVDHIEEFVKYGVNRFAADSLHEIEKIYSVSPKARVYIRMIANDAKSVFKFSEKFGTDAANIIPLLIRVKELGMHPYGISYHVGSQASDPKAWGNVLVVLRSIISELEENGIKIDAIDIGGGFPCRYATSVEIPTLDEIAEYTLMEYDKLPYKPKLVLEPGRGVVADSGILVASVIARIERGESTWLFLDAGVYNGLFEAMSYQGSTRYPMTSIRPVGPEGEAMFELAGPTGDSPDVIAREALLPKDIQVGDKLIFHNTGAYNLFFNSTFNGFPKPDVYFL